MILWLLWQPVKNLKQPREQTVRKIATQNVQKCDNLPMCTSPHPQYRVVWAGRDNSISFASGWKEKSRVCMRNSEGLMSVWRGSDLVTLEATGVIARDGIRGISMGRNCLMGHHSADQYSISIKVPGKEETGRSRECIWTMVKYLQAWKKMRTYKSKKLNAICDINFGCQLVGLQYPHKNSLLGASVRALQAGLTGMGRHTLIWAAQACTHTEKIHCFKNGCFQL